MIILVDSIKALAAHSDVALFPPNIRTHDYNLANDPYLLDLLFSEHNSSADFMMVHFKLIVFTLAFITLLSTCVSLKSSISIGYDSTKRALVVISFDTNPLYEIPVTATMDDTNATKLRDLANELEACEATALDIETVCALFDYFVALTNTIVAAANQASGSERRALLGKLRSARMRKDRLSALKDQLKQIRKNTLKNTESAVENFGAVGNLGADFELGPDFLVNTHSYNTWTRRGTGVQKQCTAHLKSCAGKSQNTRWQTTECGRAWNVCRFTMALSNPVFGSTGNNLGIMLTSNLLNNLVRNGRSAFA